MDYFLSKLSNIIYRINIHEGNANNRLASESPKILFQLGARTDCVPDHYKKDFEKLIELVEKTLSSVLAPGLLPVRIKGIYNCTAARYIKLLIDIQYELEEQRED